MNPLEVLYRRFVEPFAQTRPRLFAALLSATGMGLVVLMVFRVRIAEQTVLEKMKKLEKTSARVAKLLGKKEALEARFENLAKDGQSLDLSQALEKLLADSGITGKPEKTLIKTENLLFSKQIQFQTTTLSFQALELKKAMDFLNALAMTPGLSAIDFELLVADQKVNMKLTLVHRKLLPKTLNAGS